MRSIQTLFTMNQVFRRKSAIPFLLVASAMAAHMAMAVELVRENFDGSPASGLSGVIPATNLLSPGTAWVADSIIAANGQVTDGSNTDRGAWLDMGADFNFQPDSTYVLSLGWEDLSNSIVFAGFMVAQPNQAAQMQTQDTNFALRARLIAPTDPLASWIYAGSSSAVVGSTLTPTTGSTTLTLNTNSLTDAVFTVDGVSRTIDLSAGYRYLWIAYEDPSSGESNARFVSLTLNGPEPLVLPVVSILPESTLVPAGQLITLSASEPDSAIHFTLDGSVPSVGSTLYTAPFPLNASATVRAIAIHPTLGTGPVAQRAFTITEPIGTPNLLIIVADDVGFGDLQCYGGVNIATPTLDSLAYDGIRFTQFTTTGPGNAASQYALLTGRVAARSGMGASVAPNASGWQAEEWTLAELLRRRGYSTAFIGEWHLGNAKGSHPNDQGFQLFHGLPYAMAGNPPLEENQEVVNPTPDPALLLSGLTTRAKSYIAAASKPFALVFQAPALPASGSSIAGTHGNRVEALDSAVGELLAELDVRGLADNTLVIFLSDGGAVRTVDGGSNGMLRDGAGTTWEGGLRAPLIARLPGALPPAQMNLSLLWLPDLMPTLASLTGGMPASDRPLDGSPRTAVLTGTQTRPTGDEIVYGFRHEGNAWKLTTVRQGKWKSHLSIVNIDPLNGNPTTGSQLYDLHIDAEERINRASGQPAIVTQLQSLATSYGASLPVAGTTDLPAPKPAVIDGISTTLENSTSAVRFEFSRPADSLNENYRIEHSDDLIAWEILSITPYVISLTPRPNQKEDLNIHVPLGVPPIDGERRFLRMRAERPANP